MSVYLMQIMFFYIFNAFTLRKFQLLLVNSKLNISYLNNMFFSGYYKNIDFKNIFFEIQYIFNFSDKMSNKFECDQHWVESFYTLWVRNF